MPKLYFHRGRVRRAGVSLLEVIFSVGVIMIGLLGVAVLIPTAGRIAQKGSTLDQASRAGQNWLRDLETRGYTQPAAWVIADGGPTAAYQNDTFTDPMGNVIVTTYAHEKPFCIDPRFAATNNDSYFPYPATVGFARMRRITLRAAPGAGRMQFDQADELFIGHDDLVFDRPVDPTLVPTQVYGQVGGGKRQSEDRISYILTVVPKLQGFRRYRDTYIVSTVVFRNRDPSMTTASKAPEPDNERWVEVSAFHGSSGGGDAQVGDIQLQSRVGRKTAEALADVTVHRGDWLMLSGNSNAFTGYNNAGAPQYQPTSVFRWYRVVHADEPQLNAANRWVVDATLHGPDWNSSISTQATVMTDVVAVYEKTMRLENSSLWMR